MSATQLISLLVLNTPISAHSLKGSLVLSYLCLCADTQKEALWRAQHGLTRAEGVRGQAGTALGGLGWRQRVEEETSAVVQKSDQKQCSRMGHVTSIWK